MSALGRWAGRVTELLQGPRGRELVVTVLGSAAVTLAASAVIVVQTAREIEQSARETDARQEQRIEENNAGLCRVLTTAANPPPRPPDLTGPATPTAEAGRRIAAYQLQRAAWEQRFQADMAAAREQYC